MKNRFLNWLNKIFTGQEDQALWHYDPLMEEILHMHERLIQK